MRGRYDAVAALAAMGVVLCLAGCGQAEQAEQFIEGEESGKDNYQTLVDDVMADKKVNSAEAKQTADAYIQCLTESGVAGTYHYNPATYFWVNPGDLSLSADNPKFRYMDLDPTSVAGKKLSDDITAAYNKATESCTSTFKPVSEYLESHADWAALDKGLYEATASCVADYIPALNASIDDSWSHDGKGLQQLNEMIAARSPELSANDQQALLNCQNYQTVTPETFGTLPKPLDQLTEEERNVALAKGQLSEQQ